ncbi:gamma-glutamyltransferase [Desulfosediminicola flagellatus]|uniref:gamma-glutamyltransferase n=1 Tax=Desulfosediminicola flagellatus TaxID=2569541 RepID=UPI00142EB37E|nr:gamma-glutamyltransferase [Desulfosediminicola flagellatus]
MSSRKYTKSIVAAGHPEVCRAASILLEAGGNAFDAVVAAGFASTVVEPALTSLGGGGFMLGFNARSNQDICVDFFVDTPGKGHLDDELEPHFFPVTVNFSGAAQVFNIGMGSVAVPGTLRGLLHIHKKHGVVGLRDVVEPARRLAMGHELNGHQGHFLDLLRPIMTFHKVGRTLYMPEGNYICAGDSLVNEKLADYLEQVVLEGDANFYRGDIAEAIAREMRQNDGLLTLHDLAGYTVHERKPLGVKYRNSVLLTAPEPSMGGTLIGLSLALADSVDPTEYEWGSSAYLLQTVHRMKTVEKLRCQGITNPRALEAYLATRQVSDSDDSGRLFSRGTTHISIADSDGNCASMTCSNGEGSGYYAPSTGIMLNNMMGEDDLHPEGFHSSPPGERVHSMMSPSLLKKGDEIELVIGSGGSKRIRTAISQVLGQVVDYGRGIDEAVEAPRLYWDENCVQIEPGFSTEAVKAIEAGEQVHVWQGKDVYFGGVHCVVPGQIGAADSRRGGAVSEIQAD